MQLTAWLLQGWSAVTEQQRDSDGGLRPQYLPSRRTSACFDGASADAFPGLGLPAAAPPSSLPAATASAGPSSNECSPASGPAAPVAAPPDSAVAPGRGVSGGAACSTLDVSNRPGPRRVGRSASPAGSWRGAAQPAGAASPGLPSRPGVPQAPGLRLRRSSSTPDMDATAADRQALHALASAHPWAPQDMLEVRLSRLLHGWSGLVV